MAKKLQPLFPDATIPVKLQHQWLDIMKHLHRSLFNAIPSARKHLKNVDNVIILGDWHIKTCFINNTYLVMEIDFKKENRLTMRYTGKLKQLSAAMFAALS